MRELRYVGPGVEPDRVIVELLDGSEQFSLPVAAVVHHSTQTDLLGAPAPTVVDEPPAPASARLAGGRSGGGADDHHCACSR